MKIWRKKRGGKYYGECIVTIAGEEVRLGTKNHEVARKRLPAAMKGRREFESDAAAAAAASEPDVDELGGQNTGPVAEGTNPIGPPSSPAPVAPDAVIPPAPQLALPPISSSANAQAEADATNAAAAETAGAGGDQGTDELGENMPPEVVAELLGFITSAIVEGQLQLQAWLIKKRTGMIAGPIPADSKLRTAGEKAWARQFEIWFPDVSRLPPWAVAVGAPLICALQQTATATPPPKDPEKPADPQPAQAAA